MPVRDPYFQVALYVTLDRILDCLGACFEQEAGQRALLAARFARQSSELDIPGMTLDFRDSGWYNGHACLCAAWLKKS